MKPVFPEILLILFWNVAMAVLFWMYLKDMLKSPGAKFVFGISDIWALTLGLTPLLLASAYLIEMQDYGMLIMVLGVGVPHGLAGTYLATLYNSFMRHDTARSQWAAFFSTVAGAFLGTTLFAIVSLFLLGVVVFFLGAYVTTFPWSVVATVVVFSLRAYYRNKRTRTISPPNNATSVNDRSRDA
jgi:MFS family permease